MSSIESPFSYAQVMINLYVMILCKSFTLAAMTCIKIFYENPSRRKSFKSMLVALRFLEISKNDFIINPGETECYMHTTSHQQLTDPESLSLRAHFGYLEYLRIM